MNILFHFLFNYLFFNAVYGNAWDYLVIIFIFSTIMDIDHLPYILKTRSDIVKKRFGSEARTRFHEIYGLAAVSVLACILYFFIGTYILLPALTCLVLHLAVDFLTGKSMPFYPYSRKEVFLDISPSEYRTKIFFELSATLIMGVLFWVETANLIL